MAERKAHVERNTSETKIIVDLNLDGSGKYDIDTGIGFFDHMLNSFAKHGFFDLTCKVDGDLEVDCHHTIEDTGIVLGQAIREAVGNKKGIRRFGNFLLPMDETLVLGAVDLSGRPYCVCDLPFTVERVGGFDTEMVQEFFYARDSCSAPGQYVSGEGPRRVPTSFGRLDALPYSTTMCP